MSLVAYAVLWRLRMLTLDSAMVVLALTMLVQLIWAYRACDAGLAPEVRGPGWSGHWQAMARRIGGPDARSGQRPAQISWCCHRQCHLPTLAVTQSPSP